MKKHDTNADKVSIKLNSLLWFHLFSFRLELLNLDFNDIKEVPQVSWPGDFDSGDDENNDETNAAVQEMHQLLHLEKLACHPLDKGLHIIHNPLMKPLKEVLDGGLSALFNYLRSG